MKKENRLVISDKGFFTEKGEPIFPFGEEWSQKFTYKKCKCCGNIKMLSHKWIKSSPPQNKRGRENNKK